MTPPASDVRGDSARTLAARVLVRVSEDRAFAAAALEAELTRAAQLEPRDRALATELVYGSLRVEPWLLAELGRFVPRGIASVEAPVRAHLVLASYQLVFTRVPAFAAVNEAVGAVRAARGQRVGAFANAVLRKMAARAAQVDDTAREHAVVSSAPAWLRASLERALSADGARAFLRSAMTPPPTALRVEERAARDEWLAKLRSAAPAASFDAGRLSAQAILARGAGKVHRLPGWSEGAWAVQEEGSQLAAMAVGAREGERVLDACAGRGNKAAVLARQVAGRGQVCGAVDACDSSPSKLERLAQEFARLGLRVPSTFAVDWRLGSGDVAGQYDRILVDAPCSGIGTLRRRPEIGLRREQAELEGLAQAQLAIASRAAEHLRPGGTLTYVVCSVLLEEAEEVLAPLLASHPDLEPAPFESPEARAIAGGDATSLRLLPHVHGTDGYFIANVRRR